MSNFERCVIATRESPLAMWQALHIQSVLRARYPSASVELLGMTTRGDQILDRTLSKVGGKGLFVKELEVAMEAGEADLAVHSLKDVPMELPEGFDLVAVSEREDPRDAFVSPKYASLDDMPAGARVGTASLRRELMLRMNYPHLEVLPVRGNVGTRLRKLDAGEYDALVMASAGLKRLELHDRIRSIIPAEVSLPSPGQGALGVEIRSDNAVMHEALAFLNDPHTRACCTAERAVFQHHFNFHGRVAARVQNLATEHIDDDAHACLLVGFPALPHRHGKDALRGNHSTSEAQSPILRAFPTTPATNG